LEINIRKKLVAFFHWLPALLYMSLVFYFSHRKPLLETMAGNWSFHGIDKIAHFAEYFILFILLYKTLHVEKHEHPQYKALALSVLFGLSDEFHQSFLSYRDCEFGDVIADSTGAFIAFIIIVAFRDAPDDESEL